MNKPRFLLTLIAVSFGVSGYVEATLGRRTLDAAAAATAHILLVAVLSFMWCKADTARRGIVARSQSALWVGLIPIAGMPLYFFRSMPVKAASLSTLAGVVYLAVCITLQIGGEYLASMLITESPATKEIPARSLA